jgi:protein involved in polysaccharide export with SLBB domain
MQQRIFAKAMIFMCAIGVASLVRPAYADAYRLVSGDRIEVAYIGQGRPEGVFVDVDGQVRLPGIGGVSIAGQTLDEAEAAIATAVDTAGLYIDPVVSVTLIEYAPFVVSGDVTQPGRFEFLPGTTIAAALALSGGGQPTGISRFEIERARIEISGQLRTLSLEAAAKFLQIKRLQATLANEPSINLTAQDELLIPGPQARLLEELLAGELSILETDRRQTEETLTFFDAEIRTIESQIQLFDQRISVQNEIVASVAEDLGNARALQERGLQTASRTLAAEQRDADARSRALELESAKVAAARATGDAQRNRAQFLANRRDDALRALQEARVSLEDLRLRYARQTEQSRLLEGGNISALLDAETVDYEFMIIRNQNALSEDEMQNLTLGSLLLPGDTLIVRVQAQRLE